jgi:hypothetical protein
MAGQNQREKKRQTMVVQNLEEMGRAMESEAAGGNVQNWNNIVT